MPVFFKNRNFVPQGGFFYETHGERVSANTFIEIEPKVRALMRKYNISGSAEQAVAEYMYAKGAQGGYLFVGHVPGPKREPMVLPREAMKNSEYYAGRQVVPFDVVEERLRTCLLCPRHTREFCVTCTGHMNRILLIFNGRRPSVPEDRGSGICRCAKAYEAALASVEYGKDEAVWPDAPDTCWRRK